jgi:hypothetical protein
LGESLVLPADAISRFCSLSGLFSPKLGTLAFSTGFHEVTRKQLLTAGQLGPKLEKNLAGARATWHL